MKVQTLESKARESLTDEWQNARSLPCPDYVYRTLVANGEAEERLKFGDLWGASQQYRRRVQTPLR